VPTDPETTRRSLCPINAFVEIFGDRWSLLIVRDLMMRGYTSYTQLRSCEERIATNILAEKLDRLVAAGVIEAAPDPEDGRRICYRLTEKGIDLAPVIAEVARWSLGHEPNRTPPRLADQVRAKPAALAAELRRRWAVRSTDPMLPLPAAARPARAPPKAARTRKPASRSRG